MKFKLPILNFFGLTTLKDQADTVNHLLQIERELDEKRKAAEEELYRLKQKDNNLFNWDIISGKIISYEDYKNENNILPGRFDNVIWRHYYDKTHRNPHQAYKMRLLTLNPDMLNAFMTAFAAFNWQEVADYMERTNWFWSDRKRSPTVQELQDCVITLLPNNIEELKDHTKESGWSSGGFEVCLFYKDNKATCKIKFDKTIYK